MVYNMRISAGGQVYDLLYDQLYAPSSQDNPWEYDQIRIIDSEKGCRLGVRNVHQDYACLIQSAGSPNNLQENVILSGDRLWLVIGRHVCQLRLSDCELDWNVEVLSDYSYHLIYLADEDSLVVHAYADLIKMSSAGEIIWTCLLPDVLLPDIEVHQGVLGIWAEFGAKYMVSLATGDLHPM